MSKLDIQHEYVDLAKIRRTLKARGLTPYDVADESGISERTARRQIGGYTPMQVGVFCTIADLCNVSPLAFLFGRDWRAIGLEFAGRETRLDGPRTGARDYRKARRQK